MEDGNSARASKQKYQSPKSLVDLEIPFKAFAIYIIVSSPEPLGSQGELIGWP